MKEMPNQQPPKLASRLFDWWGGRALTEDLKGDLEEGFYENLEAKGSFKAKWIYTYQVLTLCFSYALKRRKDSAAYSPYYATNSLAMFNNYFKIAMRNFMKQKLFTSINLLGLALGMSICLLAISITYSILESDNFHEKKERVFQINAYLKDADQSRIYGSVFPAVGDYMEEKYPFIETALNIHSGFRPVVNHHGNLLDFHGYYVDPEFFQVFSFKLIEGDPRTALAKPNTIILTKSVAEKLFRDADPMGKVLETETGSFTVTGVMPDLKETHLYFQVLTSQQTYKLQLADHNPVNDWKQYRNHYLYLLLKPETQNASLQDALAQTSVKAEEFNPETSIELQSVRLDKAVPRWDISNAIGIGWDYPSLLFFFFIGLLILLPAIFNYTNLSIARAMKRAKEIGIRKVVGAQKAQIKAQFIVETVIMTILALVGSMFVFVIVQNELLDMIISAEVLNTSIRPSLVVVFIIFGLIIGVLSGLFPAVYFSRLSPIHSLKGDMKPGSFSVSGIKKGLFVFQFALSLFFIIGVATIVRQYHHVFNRQHGFDSENVLTIAFNGQNKEVALQELARHPDVKAVTTTSHLPGINMQSASWAIPNGKDTLQASEIFIGDDFVKNMNMELVWGFSPPKNQSTHNEELVMVNEEFLRAASVFDRAEDTLTFVMEDGRHARISGVLKDLHYEPLSREIRPMIFRKSTAKSQFVLLSLQSNDIQKTIGELEEIWTEVDQKVPFEASFLDDEIERAYKFLTVQIKIFSFLGALAIVISCLGLLGMVSYTTENRTKEIAIRKIMGASVSSIYLLLTRDFIRLIGYSALLAIPLAYVFYDKMFLYFLIRYGLGLGFWEVLASVFFLFLLGFFFIFWQTSKVAQSNPATNLRYE